MMTIGEAFTILKIPISKDPAAIRHAFALQSKAAHPEENPDAWKQLVEAYQRALQFAQSTGTVIPTVIPSPDQKAVTLPDEDNWGVVTDPEEPMDFGFLEELEQQYSDTHKKLAAQTDMLQQILSRQHRAKKQKFRELLAWSKALTALLQQLGPEQLTGREIAATAAAYAAIGDGGYFPPRLRREMASQLDLTISLLGPLEDLYYDQFMRLQRIRKTYAPCICMGPNAFVALFILFLVLGLNMLFGVSKRQTITVPVGTAHYEDYSNTTPAGTSCCLTLQSAELAALGCYTAIYLSDADGNYTQYFAFVSGQTADGSTVLLCYSNRVLSGVLDTDQSERNAKALVQELQESAPLQILGTVEALDYEGHWLTTEPGVHIITPTNFTLAQQYPEGTLAFFPDSSLPAEGEALTQFHTETHISPLHVVLAAVSFLILLLLVRAYRGKLKWLRVIRAKKRKV